MAEDTGEEADLALKSPIDTRRARGDIEVTAATEAEVVHQKPKKVAQLRLRQKEQIPRP